MKAATILLTSFGALAMAVVGATAVGQSQRDIGGIDKVAQIEAAADGSAWALTTGGRILHCSRSVAAREDAKIICYDQNGKTRVSY